MPVDQCLGRCEVINSQKRNNILKLKRLQIAENGTLFMSLVLHLKVVEIDVYQGLSC